MKLVPLDRFGPAPMHDFLGYPGTTPDSSFIFTPEGIIELTDADAWSEARSVLSTLGSTPIEERLPILCVGSNANPPQALEKIRKSGNSSGDPNVAFLLAEVPNVRAFFAGHIGVYGAVPATLDAAPGATATFFVGFYTRRQLPSLIASEHDNYVLSTMSSAPTLIDPATQLSVCNFFLSRKGVLVLDGDAPIPLHKYCQSEILALLFEALGPRESLPSLAGYLETPKQLGPVLERAIDRAGFWRTHRLEVDHIEPSELKPVSSVQVRFR